MLLGVTGSIVTIAACVWGIVRWWHRQIVDAVSGRLASIDNAVNHRKEGEPRLVEMVEDTLSEVRDMRIDMGEVRVDLERLNTKVERHLGEHAGLNS